MADTDLLELKKTKQFFKDLKRIVKRRLDIDLLDEIIQTLRERKPLGPKHRDHALTGDYAGFREGSVINHKTNEKTCSGVAKKAREKAKTDENSMLQEDMLFPSPSAAAMFVTGASANGYAVWRIATRQNPKEVEATEASKL